MQHRTTSQLHHSPIAPSDQEEEVPGVRPLLQDRAKGGGRPHRPAPVSYTHLTLPTICSV
eukprot:11016568-Alexandrium_andersonii.AAC.1